MGNETFGKKEREKKKRMKRMEKEEKKQHRKDNNDKGKDFADLLVFVDAEGNLVDTPPEGVQFGNLPTPSPERALELEKNKIAAAKARAAKFYIGEIKTYDESRGFGYIIDQNQQSIFVHRNQCKFDIAKGDKVKFEIDRNEKGKFAFNVVKAEVA